MGTIDSEMTMREIGHIMQYGQTAYLNAVSLYVSTYWRQVIQSIKQTYKIMCFTSPPCCKQANNARCGATGHRRVTYLWVIYVCSFVGNLQRAFWLHVMRENSTFIYPYKQTDVLRHGARRP